MDTENQSRLTALCGELRGEKEHDRAVLLQWAERYRGDAVQMLKNPFKWIHNKFKAWQFKRRKGAQGQHRAREELRTAHEDEEELRRVHAGNGVAVKAQAG